ncbi:MAG: hypothetical protein ACPGJS_20420 [Flammeovirgaceae bacterium]
MNPQIIFGDQSRQIHLTTELMNEWGIPTDAKYLKFQFSNGLEFVNPFKRSFRRGKKIILPKIFRKMAYLSVRDKIENIDVCNDAMDTQPVDNVKVKILEGSANKQALWKAIQRQNVFFNHQICCVKTKRGVITCLLDVEAFGNSTLLAVSSL